MTPDVFIGWAWQTVVGVDLGRVFSDQLMPTMEFRAERDVSHRHRGRWMTVEVVSGAVGRWRSKSAARAYQRRVGSHGIRCEVRLWKRDRVFYVGYPNEYYVTMRLW